jgi:hypothetical protein
MADEKLVEELAEHLARRMFAEGRFLAAEGMPARWEDMPADQQRAWVQHVRENTARPALEWLAERGRLVPDGSEVDEDRATAIIQDREMRWPPTVAGVIPDGVKDGEMVRRTVITTPWVAVAPEPVAEETT